jgi:hypothetical protein
VRSFCGSHVQNYHLVRRLKKLGVKFVRDMLKNYSIKIGWKKLCVKVISIIVKDVLKNYCLIVMLKNII